MFWEDFAHFVCVWQIATTNRTLHLSDTRLSRNSLDSSLERLVFTSNYLSTDLSTLNKHQEMSSAPKKVTIKSDTWYLDANVVQQVGYQQSPLFGTESTKFYLRAEKSGTDYSFHLYLAACPEEKIKVEAKFWDGNSDQPDKYYKYTVEQEVSLDKTQKIGNGGWTSFSRYISIELTFEEIDVSAAQITQHNLYEELSNQLLILRGNANSADITLVTTVDGREFPVHKNIIASRSAVFAAMFEHSEFKENQKNRVEIEDVTGEVMDELLKFIYSADVCGIEKIAGELLQAADKYDLPLLMKVCVQSLLARLSVDTAAKCFYLVDLYRLEDAKKTVINFIAANRQAVRKSASWKQYIGHEQLEQLYDSML